MSADRSSKSSPVDPASDPSYRTWKRQSPLGLLVVGFGASLLGHATLMRGRGDATWKWVAAGTASLIALNAGLSLFGDAVKHRTLYEVRAADTDAESSSST